jgi:hypothetical protein
MAAAVAGPLLVSQLTADIGALVGLGTNPAQTREEVFAPYCGRWVKVRLLYFQTRYRSKDLEAGVQLVQVLLAVAAAASSDQPGSIVIRYMAAANVFFLIPAFCHCVIASSLPVSTCGTGQQQQSTVT